MNKFFIAVVVLVLTPFVSFSQTSTTTGTTSAQITGTTTPTTTIIVDAGLAPGDFLYFFDRWMESLNLTITFNKEKKARKHIEYAKERVSEMSEVLSDPTATLSDVALAKDDFDTQIADAAALVKSEKDNGADVAGLALELDDELDDVRDALKDIYKEHSEVASRAEEEILAKLASLTATDPQVQGLTRALESITKEKGHTEDEEDGLEMDLFDEQAIFEEIMGEGMSAQKHLDEAMRLRGVVEQGLPASLSTSSEKFMKDAKAAMRRGDFESAKRMSKDAERALEKAREESMLMEGGVGDLGEFHVNSLEQEIQKSEKMMEGFSAGEPMDDTNDINR